MQTPEQAGSTGFPLFQEPEPKLRSIIESVPNGLVIVAEDGAIALCNSEAERMFGYGDGELVGKPVEVLVPERLRDRHPIYRQGFTTDPSKRQMGAGRDLTGVRKDGTELPVEIGLNHVRTGGALFVIAAIVDITERKKQEERFRTIVESVPNGIIMADEQGTIVLCNSEAERLFGYENDELLDQPVERLVPVPSQKGHPRDRARFARDPRKRQMGAGRDLSGLRKDGSEVPVEIGLSPIETPTGRFVLASIVDISERKAIDNELHAAYEALQRKNEEMEQFVHTVSHDLKAPLVTSTSFISFLKEDLAERNLEQVEDSLERLERAHKRMQELINDLLELSRVGRMTLHMAPVALQEVAAEVAESFADQLRAGAIELEVAPDLPEVMADRRRVHQIFENLVGNAIKYGAEGDSPRIQVLWSRSPQEIRLCVKDNGPGIDPQYHQKIFGLFQRLDSTQEGTGVGLTVVSRIMQLHGGRVWVESALGRGAEFWVGFPADPTLKVRDDL